MIENQFHRPSLLTQTHNKSERFFNILKHFPNPLCRQPGKCRQIKIDMLLALQSRFEDTIMNKFAILVPCYNEEGNVTRTATRIEDVLEKHNLNAQLVLVNDGSQDKTAEEMTFVSEKYQNITILTHEQNKGFGCAIKTGLAHIIENKDQFDFMLMMEADLTVDPNYIPQIKENIDQGFEFVIATRYSDGGKMQNVPFYRHIISFVSSLIADFCFALPIKDYTIAFRGITMNVLSRTVLREDNFPLLIEQIYRSMHFTEKFKSIPVVFNNREVGESKFNYSPAVFMNYLKYALKALFLRIRKRMGLNSYAMKNN